MAPYAVRRTVLTVEAELSSCFADSEAKIASELVRRSLRSARGSENGSAIPDEDQVLDHPGERQRQRRDHPQTYSLGMVQKKSVKVDGIWESLKRAVGGMMRVSR